MSEPKQYTGHINCQKCGKTHWIGAQCEPNQNEIPTPITDNAGKFYGRRTALKELEIKVVILQSELTEMTAIAKKCRTRELEQLKEIEEIKKQCLEAEQKYNALYNQVNEETSILDLVKERDMLREQLTEAIKIRDNAISIHNEALNGMSKQLTELRGLADDLFKYAPINQNHIVSYAEYSAICNSVAAYKSFIARQNL